MLEQFDEAVRCSQGHLYTSTWLPYASVKALRLGRRRWQHCPVGHHWAMTTRLDPAITTSGDLAEASKVHDWRIP
jgi:hypothetical protein